MAQMVLHFGWTWVGIIAADDDYGKYGIKEFKEQVEEAGVCISFSETLPKVNPFQSKSSHLRSFSIPAITLVFSGMSLER